MTLKFYKKPGFYKRPYEKSGDIANNWAQAPGVNHKRVFGLWEDPF